MTEETQNNPPKARKRKNVTAEVAVFAALSAIMFASKVLMDALPNVHLLGAFIMAFTLVYGVRALIPIYGFVFITGLVNGFDFWWLAYLYIWAVLWGVTMLLPRKRFPKTVRAFIYAVVCGLYGLVFGALYAPVWAYAFHLDFAGTLAWIAAGSGFDILHAVSNFAVSLVIVVPLSDLLKKITRGVIPLRK